MSIKVSIVNIIFWTVISIVVFGLGYLVYCAATAVDEGPYIVKVYTISGQQKYQYIGNVHFQKHTRTIIHVLGDYPDK